MIATVALAGYLLAEADFSRSGRRKMASGVLDDGTLAALAVAYKSVFRVQSAH